MAFVGTKLVVVDDGTFVRTPGPAEMAQALAPDASTALNALLPDLDGRSVVAHDLPAGFEPPPGMAAVGLRALNGRCSDAFFRVAGAALQKIEWARTHRFCARCGTPTERHERHEAMACAACGQLHFPRLAPAVIVLVERESEMLLARSPHFAEGVYSTLAGFVEPGESLEDTVHREIREEVGVEVADVRYFGSQSWPFPHSLMVGFTATWAGGDIRMDDDEIEDAAWFSADRMPPRLPFPLSIARRLVDDFLDRTAPGGPADPGTQDGD